MASSLTTTHDSSSPSRKTRATSCTTCRQVKLKCDLKDKYPSPCSRCASNGHECRVDATFKRVPARSRIRDLESQIDQLKRARTLRQTTPPTTSRDFTIKLERQGSYADSVEDNADANGVSSMYSSASPASSDHSQAGTQWLNVADSENPAQFVLFDYTICHRDALELFQWFELLFVPHFCILEPVFSLAQLHEESQLLFWTIISVTSRVHRRHSCQSEQLKSAEERLVANVTTRAVQSLQDLHAILILCSWPCPTTSHTVHDPSWMQLGLAMNSARQMGLDRPQKEVILSAREPWRSLARHSVHVRQATWMKCIELDVQMSCWHGQLPSLAHPHILRVTTDFCNTSTSSGSHAYAALINIHVELVQSLATLDEALANDTRPQPYIVRLASERFIAVRAKWRHAWTLDAEIELLIANLYLFTFCLTRLNSDESPILDHSFNAELLEASRSNAIQLVNIVANLSAEAQANLPSSEILTSSQPLPGRPEHHAKSLLFAALVLLNSLDSRHALNEEDSGSARNAFGKAYQFFAHRDCHDDASRLLELLGKNVIQGQAHLQTLVTTRMGASLRYNALWLADQLQEQQQIPEHEQGQEQEEDSGETMERSADGSHSMIPLNTSQLLDVRQQPFAYDMPTDFAHSNWQRPPQITGDSDFGLESTWNNTTLECWALSTRHATMRSLEDPFDINATPMSWGA